MPVITTTVDACAHSLTPDETAAATKGLSEDQHPEALEVAMREKVHVRVDAPEGHMIVSVYGLDPLNLLPTPWPVPWLLCDEDGYPNGALFLRRTPMGEIDRSYSVSIVCIPRP